MRYAQEKRGQKLHLVDEVEGGVALRTLCGHYAENSWGMTINLPLGRACRNCVRVYNAEQRTPRTYEVA